MRGRHRTAVPSRRAASGNTGYDGDTGRAHSNLRSPTTEIGCVDARECDQLWQRPWSVTRVWRMLAEFAHRRNRHHAGYIAREMHGTARVTGAGDAGDAIQSCLGDLLCHEFGELFAADTDLHDIQASLDALIQCFNEIAVVAARHHFEYMHFSARRTADNVGRCESGGRDNAGTVGARPQLVRFPTLRIFVSGQIHAPDDMTEERVRGV